MKHRLFIKLAFFTAVIFFSCSAPDQPANSTDSTGITEAETIIEQPDTVLFWTVNIEKKEKVRVYKDTAGINDPVSIINGINTIYPDIRLEFVKLSGDTVYTHIDSASAFSDDVGSFGAAEYIAGVVINLTTLPDINYVNLDFPVGSHATPGVYSKSGYAAYTEKEEP